MNKNALVAGTLAGLLTGASYVYTPVYSKEPRPERSPAPSTYVRVDPETAKLQERMRDICNRTWYYQKNMGYLELGPPEDGPIPINPAVGETLPKCLPKGFSEKGMLVLGIESKYVATIDRNGKSVMYNPSCLEKGKFFKVLIAAYEGTQSRCQEGTTNLKTSVRAIGNKTYINNSKARVSVANDISNIVRVLEQVILNGSGRTDMEVQTHELTSYCLLLSVSNLSCMVVYDGRICSNGVSASQGALKIIKGKR